jgi:single stranded DNA-binding protein
MPPYSAHCSLLGHITADPELKVAGDTKYAKFSLAVDTRAKINGTWGKRCTFWRCTVWGKEAEWFSRDARKGSLVYVEGEPYSEDYEKDGVKKQSPHHVRCNTAKCLDARKAKDAMESAPKPEEVGKMLEAPSSEKSVEESPF